MSPLSFAMVATLREAAEHGGYVHPFSHGAVLRGLRRRGLIERAGEWYGRHEKLTDLGRAALAARSTEGEE